MSRRLVVLVQALVALVVVTACDGGGGKPSGPLPDAGQTLQKASQAMAGLKSVGLTLATEDKPPIMVQGGDLKLLRNGDAEGTLRIEQAGQGTEMRVVALGDTFYIKYVTGGWQRLPKALASRVYDPSAVLDPQRGIAKLLTSVQSPKSEAVEKVNGRDAVRVKVRLPQAAIGGLVPGITSDLDGQVWVSTADHRLVKVRGVIPGEGGKGAVTIGFTEFDAPYKISAPR